MLSLRFSSIRLAGCRCLVRKYGVPATYHHPTVYALSTPANQRSAIAIIRISGTNARYILDNLCEGKIIHSRRPMLRKLSDPRTGVLIDEALILYFPQPRTFTGEDLVELHLHGGKAIIKAALNCISSLNSPTSEIRMAMPGEFSRRAFQNGKMDLLKLEGINSLIHSETELQRISHLKDRENRELFTKWRNEIIDQMAKLTAIIDFGEDIEQEDMNSITEGVSQKIIVLNAEINKFMSKLDRMSILNEGIRMTLLGEPNSGKSSLINEISQDDIAIVSNIPGTTRDSIDVVIDINGFKCIITDTAGIRKGTSDSIEIKGIDRSKKKSLDSDIVALVVDASDPDIDKELQEFIETNLAEKPLIIALNKIDLVNSMLVDKIMADLQAQFPRALIKGISCTKQVGINTLIKSLTIEFKRLSNTEDEDPITISSRIKEILTSDLLYGIEAFFKFNNENDILMACESLRIASDGIGKITGENIDLEEVLDVVFSKFCIGK